MCTCLQIHSDEVMLKFNTDFHSRYNGEDYNAAFTFNRYCVIAWFYVFISSVIVVSVCAGGGGGGGCVYNAAFTFNRYGVIAWFSVCGLFLFLLLLLLVFVQVERGRGWWYLQCCLHLQ